MRAYAIRLFLILGASIFVGEALVNLALAQFPRLSLSSAVLLDSAILLLGLYPILRFFVLRPLLAHFHRRCEAEEGQRAVEAQLRAMLDSTADGILAIDGNQEVLHASQRFGALWRIPRAVMDRADVRELRKLVLGHLVDPEAFFARAQWLYASNVVETDTIRLKDGRTFERHSVPMQLEGVRIGRVWSFRDITKREHARAQARHSQEILQSVTEGTTDAIFLKDRQGRYVMCNKATCRFAGLTREKILGEDDTALFPPEDAQTVMHLDRAIMAAGTTQTCEEFIEGGGVQRVFLSTKGPVRDESGQIIGLFGIARDITSRKRIEEVLAFLARVGSGSPMEPDFFQSLTQFLAHTLQTDCVSIDRLEGDGQSARTLATWNGGRREGNCRHDLKDTPAADALGKTVCLFPAGVRRLFPQDGRLVELDAEGYACATLRNHGGQPIGLIRCISHLPISDCDLVESTLQLVAGRAAGELERLNAEEELLAEGCRWKRAVAAADLGVLSWDISTGSMQYSERWRTMTGYSRDDVSSVESLKALIHPDDLTTAWADLHAMLAGEKEVHAAEHRLKHKQGHWIWVQSRGLVTQRSEDGAALCMVGTHLDVTEPRRAREEKAALETQFHHSQKMETVGRLAGGIAHDFNNMLGVILGNVEVALGEVGPAQPIYEELLEIQKAANRSAALTRQLLTYARKQVVAPEVLDLNETVRDLLTMLRRLLGEDIDLQWEPCAHPCPVVMDRAQVANMLTNLCLNARDAIVGVGTITLKTDHQALDASFCVASADAVPGDYVRLTVRDTGGGMDEATLAHIFEPFFTTKGVGAGTGLGLASVSGVVRQNRGIVTVSSTLGEGTTFEVYLPRQQVDAPAARDEIAILGDRRGEETILLVEDEPAMLRVTTQALTAQGYIVLASSGPEEAMRVARDYPHEIHLLLSDVVMPEMNGFDLARSMAAVRPRLKLLFMSGYTPDEIAIRGNPDHAWSVVEKPFSVPSLSAMVREVLDQVAPAAATLGR